MQVRRLAAWAALPLTVALGLSACGKRGGDSGSTNPDGVVSIGIAEPQHLLPGNTNETSGSQVLAALYSPLVDFDEANKPFEVAAESITTDRQQDLDDQAEGRLHVPQRRAGQRRQLHQRVELRRLRSERAGQRLLLRADRGLRGPQPGRRRTPTPDRPTTLTGLKKVDDKTFTVTLSAPFSEFKSMLGYTAFYPLPKAAFETRRGPLVMKTDFEEAPIGNGPFKMKGAWQHDSKIEVERYDDFKGTKPKIGGVDLQDLPEQPGRVRRPAGRQPRRGEDHPDREPVARVQGDLGDRFQTVPGVDVPVPRVPDLRRALQQARGPQGHLAWRSTARRSSRPSSRARRRPPTRSCRRSSPVTATRPVARPASSTPTEAKELLRRPPVARRTINITYNADGGHKAVGRRDLQPAQGQPGRGVRRHARGQVRRPAAPRSRTRRTSACSAWAGSWTTRRWRTTSARCTRPTVPRTTTATATRSSTTWSRRASAAPTPDEAIKKYQAAEDILAQDMPVLPLRFGQNNFGHSTKVKNVEIDLFNRVDLNKIEVS